MEYFCSVGDPLWNLTDDELVDLATREFATLNLAPGARVRHGVVIRQPKAYPVYDADYLKHVTTIRSWLAGLENFESIGRNGQHRYNNQDHSMLTGMFAAQNLQQPGELTDLWDVNVERSYYEEVVVPKKPAAGAA
jgi:protoporphyrinogen oxidase